MAAEHSIDSGHTYVLWHIDSFWFFSLSGKWDGSGKLVADEGKPKMLTKCTIQVADLYWF